jgi:myo-inositol 2-dehydrogenase / D-chiro-inositol 1-dehydrogenase
MNNDTQFTGGKSSRRDFMRHSSAAVAGAAAATFTVRTAKAGPDGMLKVGLIGCGSRGTGAVRQCLIADENTQLVALGDAFQDRVDECLQRLAGSDIKERIDTDAVKKFTGFNNYQDVIAECDIIVHATPPGFRPQHLRACVEAGKHVFAEKPVAVDPTGVRHVMETCKMAADKGLNMVSGLCYRYQFAKQDTIKQIHDGMIGDILAMQTTYNTGTLWHHDRKPEWSEMEYQVRNWLYYDWLSGDHINEQHIHSLDKVLWAMGDVPPAKATSSGGRIQRTDEKFGNVYDHFNTVYEWDNGVKAFSSCRQWDASSSDVSDHAWGTKGIAHIQTHEIIQHDGTTWKHEQTGPDDMYQNEHNAFLAAIRSGKPINDGDYMCKSTMMAIMARLAAYTGQTVTWDQMMDSKLDLSPKSYEWGDVEPRPVAVPGFTEFV